MADRDDRWNDERREELMRRRPGGERDFYRRDEYSEDRYGQGYGEEGLTNYRARNVSGGIGPGGYGVRYGEHHGYGGGERDYGGGSYGRGDYGGRHSEGRSDRGRDLQSDFSSDFEGGSNYRRDLPGYGYGGAGSRRDWGRERSFGRDQNRDERGFWDRATDEVSSWFGDDEADRRRREDARQDMRHQGRGPKGYRRSDERMREDISDRLTDDPFIDASEIEVVVVSAEVTLTGSVDSRHARRRAEDLAERVSGVTHVQNNLRVSSPAEKTREEREAGTTGTSSTSSTDQNRGLMGSKS
jgi:osmotically-inducible protein OsmY